jgi:hypothetical protein
MFSSSIINNVGRGVSLYMHESIQAVQVNFNSKFEESVWTSIKLVDGDKLSSVNYI